MGNIERQTAIFSPLKIINQITTNVLKLHLKIDKDEIQLTGKFHRLNILRQPSF